MGIGLSLICDGIFYDFGKKKRRSAGKSTGKPSELECNFYLRTLNFIYGMELIYGNIETS